jgi:hypothetical protein
MKRSAIIGKKWVIALRWLSKSCAPSNKYKSGLGKENFSDEIESNSQQSCSAISVIANGPNFVILFKRASNTVPSGLNSEKLSTAKAVDNYPA